MPFEFFVGLRYLRAKKKSTFISIITFISMAGVTVGVTALIVVISVMSGFEADLKEKILGANAHVIVQEASSQMNNYQDVASKLSKLKGVEATTPFITGQVMLSAKKISGVVLRGIDVVSDKNVTGFQKTIKYGDLSELKGETPGIVLGKELAQNLRVSVGDKIDVISPVGNVTLIGITPKIQKFKVVAIFSTGMFEYDTTLSYIDIAEAQKLFDMDGVTGLQLKVKNIYETPQILHEIDNLLGADFYSKDWMQMNKNILFALKTEKAVMFVILSLVVLVAAFGIASTLFMVVMEKTRDIAILKSMGAKSSSIMKIFVFEGLIIGCVGTFFGVTLGLLVSYNLQSIVSFIESVTGLDLFNKNVYFLDKFPSLVVPSDVAVIAATAVLISFIATLYPSWQASKMLPAEALRYE